MKRTIFLIFIAIFFTSCTKISAPKGNEKLFNQDGLGKISYLNLEIAQTSSSLPKNENISKPSGSNLLKKRFGILTLKEFPYNEKEAFWAIDVYKNSTNRQYYGMNLKPILDDWFTAQQTNANKEALGSLLLPAITTATTSLRNLPTDEPILLNPAKAGEGYPFDYLQTSTLSIGYPILISHYSLDRAWVFAANDNIMGWIKAEDVKILSQDEANELQTANFITITRDKSPVYDTNGEFLFYSRLGAILVFQREDEYKFYGRIHTRAGVKRYEISKDIASKYPLEFNDANTRLLTESLLSEPYGWGGFADKRDCSLFTQDFLNGFGVWLPRNSKAQSSVGERISLANLTNDEKFKLIKDKGVPYLTLLHLSGHIMIYAGESDGKLLVIHDVWGLRTKDKGRALIGGVAITSLDIGRDRADIDEKNLLISKIDSMNIIRLFDEKEAISRAYGVKVENNRVKFSDGSEIVFDDGLKKDKEALLANADVQDIFAEPYDIFTPLKMPVNDAGRYRNYELLDKIYGKDEPGVKANLVDVTWLEKHVNKKFKFNSQNGAAKALEAVSKELDELVNKEPKMLKFLDNPSGTFNYRVIAKTNRKSAHAYGIAIDINTDKSDYWQWSKDGVYRNQIPEQIVRIFEKHGFIWGGRWVSFDTMHFEYRPEFLYAR
ncbi:M15 family metallopeptidase [Campylobacter sp.]|uniref:M15 family metallopeptidase n=1 Tax=Campylobacter sp. TaxID=205 RepID=UPI00270933CF|nr:M15 family metallopeptidase [Campylobacter sp.]